MNLRTEELLHAAWSARVRAYAPYSEFRVGAAIQSHDGRIFDGCNVEVANYGCTVCAERTAILKAVSEGALGRGQLAAVLVAVETDTPTAPCGSCRQVIQEFGDADTAILLSNRPGEVAIALRHGDLLPRAFGPDSLERRPMAKPI